MLAYALLFILSFLPPNTPLEDLTYSVREEEKYQFADNNSCVLYMDYASPDIENPEDWTSGKDGKKISEIDLIYTKYPFDKEKWLTNYDTLLYKRIDNIFKLDSSIRENKDIKWNFIIQTNCKSAKEAKDLFHGVVIKYDKTSPAIPEPMTRIQTVRKKSLSVENIVLEMQAFDDSIVYNVFERNDWKDVVAVIDWTASMYEYGSQLLLWHYLNLENNALKGLTFFNDGDNKKTSDKKPGKTGGIYFSGTDDISQIIETMKKVMKKGNGGDAPENDIEALYKSLKKHKHAENLVLIADNSSKIRDIQLLYKINKPVKVIVCKSNSFPISKEYVELAYYTKGSIHTIDEDILNISTIREGEYISIGNSAFIFRNGRFMAAKRK